MNTNNVNDVRADAGGWSKEDVTSAKNDVGINRAEKDSFRKNFSGKNKNFSFEQHLDENSCDNEHENRQAISLQPDDEATDDAFVEVDNKLDGVYCKICDVGTIFALNECIGDANSTNLSSLDKNEVNDIDQAASLDDEFDKSEFFCKKDSDSILSLPIFEHSGSELTQKYSTHINAGIDVDSENTHTPISVVSAQDIDLVIDEKSRNIGTTDIFFKTEDHSSKKYFYKDIAENPQIELEEYANPIEQSCSDLKSDDCIKNADAAIDANADKFDSVNFAEKPAALRKPISQKSNSVVSASENKVALVPDVEKVDKTFGLNSFSGQHGMKLAKYNFNTRIEDIKKMNYNDVGSNTRDTARDFGESRNLSFAEKTHALSSVTSSSDNKLNSLLQSYESVYVKNSSASHHASEGTTTSYVDTVRGAIPAIINQIDELKKYRNKSLQLKIDLADGKAIECRLSILANVMRIQFDEMDTDLMSSLKDGWHMLSSEAAKRHINLKKPDFKGASKHLENNTTSAMHFVA